MAAAMGLVACSPRSWLVTVASHLKTLLNRYGQTVYTWNILIGGKGIFTSVNSLIHHLCEYYYHLIILLHIDDGMISVAVRTQEPGCTVSLNGLAAHCIGPRFAEQVSSLQR